MFHHLPLEHQLFDHGFQLHQQLPPRRQVSITRVVGVALIDYASPAEDLRGFARALPPKTTLSNSTSTIFNSSWFFQNAICGGLFTQINPKCPQKPLLMLRGNTPEPQMPSENHALLAPHLDFLERTFQGAICSGPQEVFSRQALQRFNLQLTIPGT